MFLKNFNDFLNPSCLGKDTMYLTATWWLVVNIEMMVQIPERAYIENDLFFLRNSRVARSS